MSAERRRFWWQALVIFLGGMLILNLGQLRRQRQDSEGSETQPRPVTPITGKSGQREQNTIRIFSEMETSVVAITNATLARDFFSLNVYEVPRGSGSGLIWDDLGHVVTNFHVIYKADKLEVIMADGQAYEAVVVGSAPDFDLAVLKIDAPQDKLKPIPLGTSKDLQVGQDVLALGNPFGLNGTLTTGIISALGRTIESLTRHKIFDVIQTDAAINPGNSGGALLDSHGRLIGVNTAILSPSGSYSGIGFAVPVDTVNRIVPQLITRGKMTRAGLGVSLIPDHIRKNWGIEGAVLMQIGNGSSAEKAGLRHTRQTPFGKIQLGDIIVQIDEQKVTTNEDLIYYIERYKQVGDKISLHFIRNGERKKTEAVLQALS